ncbi:MAG: nucleotidyltransferase domain-containing protein [Bacteroidales bacterium]|nr:nucleotidyltransferase domain-containing protein [Bacteroidales bacterium]
MRLSPTQIKLIKNTVTSLLNEYQQLELWLFGSRTNDQALGGDIDLCLCLYESDYSKLGKIKRLLRPELEEKLDIPVDLVLQNKQEEPKLVVKMAIEKGIRLI